MVETPAMEGQEELDEPDVKVILLGDSAVGKSKLVERYLQDSYDPRRLSTHALTLYRKNITLGDDNEQVKVDLWDTAGQEKFNSMHPAYYYKADVCIMVFDVTRKQVRLRWLRWTPINFLMKRTYNTATTFPDLSES